MGHYTGRGEVVAALAAGVEWGVAHGVCCIGSADALRGASRTGAVRVVDIVFQLLTFQPHEFYDQFLHAIGEVMLLPLGAEVPGGDTAVILQGFSPTFRFG